MASGLVKKLLPHRGGRAPWSGWGSLLRSKIEAEVVDRPAGSWESGEEWTCWRAASPWSVAGDMVGGAIAGALVASAGAVLAWRYRRRSGSPRQRYSGLVDRLLGSHPGSRALGRGGRAHGVAREVLQ